MQQSHEILIEATRVNAVYVLTFFDRRAIWNTLSHHVDYCILLTRKRYIDTNRSTPSRGTIPKGAMEQGILCCTVSADVTDKGRVPTSCVWVCSLEL